MSRVVMAGASGAPGGEPEFASGCSMKSPPAFMIEHGLEPLEQCPVPESSGDAAA